MKPDYSRRIGIIQILLSGFCFGFLGLFGKLAFDLGLSPGELLSLRFLLGGLLLTIFYLVVSPRKLRMTKVNLIHCITLGTLGYALFSSFYFHALRGLSASLTVLLLYMYPIFVATGGWLLYQEAIPKQRLFVLPLALVGMGLLVGGDFQINQFTGILFGIGSAVFYSLYILASRKWLRNVDTGAAVSYIQLSAGLILAMLFWREADRVSQIIYDAWYLILGLALVCSLLAMAFFQAGLKKLRGWEASILSTAEPITAVFVAIIFLDEKLNVWQTLGGLLVLSALISVSIPVRKNQ